jgi:hypothetical protein
MMVRIQYLKESELVLESWIWRVFLCCPQREMIKQMATAQICFSLRDDLRSLHGLPIPERRAVLAVVNFYSWHCA